MRSVRIKRNNNNILIHNKSFNMEYKIKVKQNILFVSLSGDMLGENIGKDMVNMINDKISDSILLCAIDLSGITYMNSSGIGILITILTKFRNKGGEVVLINPSEPIKKLLIITKLNAIFSIMNSEEEAIENLTIDN